ncbi:MAG: carboxypeptidase-like regulatory domain-containing protein, partial [Draconibacterium sp.]
MKLSLFILCLTVFTTVASESYSQSTKLSLELRDVTVSTVLKEIEAQSEFRFFYSEDIDTRREVSVNLANSNIIDVLDNIFNGTEVVYKIVGRQVALYNKTGEEVSLPATPQTREVKGTVSDAGGLPLPGVTVIVKGTTQGTVTNFDGEYSIKGDIAADAVLQFSFIGMRTQEVPVAGNTTINVQMVEETIGIDEVVAIGYGTMRKHDVTGSIAQAKGEELVKAQSFSALENLRGKVSGVNIYSNSSQPGAYQSRVVIRGLSTITSSSDPLYVVDGVVMENFGLMNPNDIERIEVLKDASAAAIYGARGANGVILVTTKRGKKDGEGARVSYQGSTSLSTVARFMDVLNAQEWTDAFMIGLANENEYMGKEWSLNRADWFTDRNYFDGNGNPLYDTDWQREATRTAISHNHQLNV